MSKVYSVNETQVSSDRASLGRSLVSGLLGGLLAAAINVVVLLVAQGLFRLEVAAPMGPGGAVTPITPTPVVITSLLPGLFAGALYWLLAKFLDRPRAVFVGITFVLLLVSFGAPLGMPGIANPVRFVLAAMHLIAAVGIVGTILKRG